MQDRADDSRPVRRLDDLLEPFFAAEKPSEAFRIGMESEKFGVHAETGAPLPYQGEQGVEGVFAALVELGWAPERELEGGPVVALRRGPASVTLEPGAQLELSGAPRSDVHALGVELDQHLLELGPVSRALGVTWLAVGFHPLAAQSELPWVPKLRYRVMREYLPPLGAGAHDMMRRTATVQANFDFSDEEDALRKLRLSLLLSALIQACTANAPFVERRTTGNKTLRGETWLNMDPSRSGLIAPVLRTKRPGYRDYVEWALDAGMFLIRREGRVVENTGQTFRSFLKDGYQGHQATLADWTLHLNTLFPEARLKNTLEVRACDSLCRSLALSVPALFTGLLYDSRALAEAEALVDEVGVEALIGSREAVVRRGFEATVGDQPARALAERMLEIAAMGLERRARLDAQGRSERVHLAPLEALVSRGKVPADLLLAGLDGPGPFPAQELIQRTRVGA